MNIDHLCFGCFHEKKEDGPCPFCGFDERSENASGLALRTLLEGRYLVGREIKINSEIAMYIGYDTHEASTILIKEFFPQNLCGRAAGGAVYVLPGKETSFTQTKEDSLALSRSLARLRELPGIYPTYDIFEENGTAYTISEYTLGVSLHSFLLENGGTMPWEKVRTLFMPLLSTIDSLHRAGIFHCGISPDSLMICEDGRLRLTEFCLTDTRTVGGVLPAELYAGYSAVEQYELQYGIGGWTDIYALAASIFRCLIGTVPPEAEQRVINDKLIVPARVAETLPTHVLSALANALQIYPADRTQAVEEFRSELAGAPSVTATVQPPVKKEKGAGQKTPGGKKPADRKKVIKLTIIASLITLVVAGTIGFFIYRAIFLGSGEEEPLPTTETTTVEATEGVETAVPDLRGITFDEEALKEMYPDFIIEKGEEQFSSDYPAGTILSQEPKDGTTMLSGTTIKVTVSKGTADTNIPSGLVGKTYEEAVSILNAAGYQNISRYSGYDGSTEIGKVVKVDPGEGTAWDTSETVALHVNILEKE